MYIVHHHENFFKKNNSMLRIPIDIFSDLNMHSFFVFNPAAPFRPILSVATITHFGITCIYLDTSRIYICRRYFGR